MYIFIQNKITCLDLFGGAFQNHLNPPPLYLHLTSALSLRGGRGSVARSGAGRGQWRLPPGPQIQSW